MKLLADAQQQKTVAIVAGSVAAGYVGWKLVTSIPYWRRSWLVYKLPGPKPDSIILGNMHSLLRKPIHAQVLEWSKQLGTLFRFRVLDRMVVIITEPDTSKYLKHGPTYMPKSFKTYSGFRRLTGKNIDSILTSPENEYYKALRRNLAPAFSVNNLKQVFPEAVTLSKQAAQYLEQTGGRALDIDNVAQRITVDVIGKMVFGIAFNACKFEEYNEPLDVVSNVLKSMQGMGLNPFYRYIPFLEKPRLFRSWCRRYGELAERIVRRAQENPPPPNSIMASLLATRDPSTGKPLKMEQLKSEVALLLVAGFETTAHSIAWTLMCLSTHPDAMRKVEQELDSMGLLATKQKPARDIEWADLGKMKVLDATINESMRLFPATSTGPARETTHDMTIQGRLIPKGTVVMLHTYAIHRSKHAWGEDAEEYKPERWDIKGDGSEGSAARRPGYQPFSLGPRDCVGQSLAVLELRTVLATLIGRMQFKLADEMKGYKATEQAARQFITLKPMVPTEPGQPAKSGLFMHCIPRRA